MKKVALQFKYKGGRKYVHGTDMYEAIIGELFREKQEFSDGFRFTIHRITTKQCDLLIPGPDDERKRPPDASAEFVCNGKNPWMCWLVENAEPVTQEYAYDEDKIAADCQIEGRRLTVLRSPEFSAIEVLVAANKLLHLASFPGAAGKWYFTRLDLCRPLMEEDRGRFILEITRDKYKLTVAEVYSGTEKLGRICFSLV